MPVGPIGALCIRRSIAFGRIDGLVTGLGAATADAFYGAVAAFGITAISDSLVRHSFVLHIIGGIALVGIGARAFAARPVLDRTAERKSRAAEYGSTVLLTLANPTTILSFAAAYVALGVSSTRSHAVYFVVGVFIGSATWWVLLSAGAAKLRARIEARGIRNVNRISGAAIAAFGIAALATAH